MIITKTHNCGEVNMAPIQFQLKRRIRFSRETCMEATVKAIEQLDQYPLDRMDKDAYTVYLTHKTSNRIGELVTISFVDISDGIVEITVTSTSKRNAATATNALDVATAIIAPFDPAWSLRVRVDREAVKQNKLNVLAVTCAIFKELQSYPEIKTPIQVERVIVKIPCQYCNNLVENTVDKCPHCGARPR
jgi:hypothetical protein